jgi:hypothetical protein
MRLHRHRAEVVLETECETLQVTLADAAEWLVRAQADAVDAAVVPVLKLALLRSSVAQSDRPVREANPLRAYPRGERSNSARVGNCASSDTCRSRVLRLRVVPGERAAHGRVRVRAPTCERERPQYLAHLFAGDHAGAIAACDFASLGLPHVRACAPPPPPPLSAPSSISPTRRALD